ncbi:MAG TPA: orotidine-5'-phosphate decarboxylase [Flavobacteriales bacterium]|nr:orotidine-5'-phosphate decarboxylase [Flavobacteriales bacterium]
MKKAEIIDQIKKKASFLCVGLDTDLQKIPSHLLSEPDPVFAFNKEIIDHTRDYCVSYKLNTAFYEYLGVKGIESMMKTIDYISDEHFVIADAKRGDIGNTSSMYAKAFFETINADAITLSPYMGRDSIGPFLHFKDKWAIVLALTSNEGADDFQFSSITENASQTRALYEQVLEKVSSWGSAENTMFVVGATKGSYFEKIRKIVPKHFLLVPGIGAQGGDLGELCRYGLNEEIGLLVNSSRAIIYSGHGHDFGVQAGKAAKEVQEAMKRELSSRNLI